MNTKVTKIKLNINKFLNLQKNGKKSLHIKNIGAIISKRRLMK